MTLEQGLNYIKSMGLDNDYLFGSETQEHINTFVNDNGDFVLEYKLTDGDRYGYGQRVISVGDIEYHLMRRKLNLNK